jgi:hypothetical protein
MKRTVFAVVLVAVLVLAVGTVFAAGGTKVCLKEGKPVRSPQGGVCKPGYTLTELGAEGKEGPAGKEGKEGPAGKEGKEGPKGATGPSGLVGAVTPGGTALNGTFTVSNPNTGEYEIIPPFGKFPVCAASSETPDTIVTPVYEGQPVMAHAVDVCKGGEPDITVKILNTNGVPSQNGFSFVSLLGS